MEQLETMLEEFTKGESFIGGCILGGVIAFFAGIAIMFAVLQIIAAWKIFEKAGEKGWKCLIPIYNIYIAFKILGIKDWWFWVFLGGTMISGILIAGRTTEINMVGKEFELVLKGYDNPASIVGDIIGSTITIITLIWVARNGAKAFNKGTGFAICLFLFPDICWLILGLGKAKYNKKAVEA